MKLFKSLLFVLLAFTGFSQQYSKVKIYATNEQMAEIAALGLPVDHGEHKFNTFFISDFSEYEIQQLADNGYNYEILIPDVKKYYAQRNLEAGNTNQKNTTCDAGQGAALPEVPANFYMNSAYAGFYKYQDMLDALDAMVAQYPNLITARAVVPNTTFNTDSTFHGNYVYYVKISNGATAADDLTKPNVLYTAIHHAREPMSMSQTLFYMWYLLENYATNEEVQFLVDSTEMFFVPCLNPDGYLINEADDPSGFGMHRKNGRPVGTFNPGVDLNRNYSYGWNTTGVSTNTNNDTYPGTSAFSEPETQSMKYLAETYGFVSAFNAHTYGNLLLFPVGTTVAEFADHHDYFAELSSHMVQHNGYIAQKSSGLYPASGDSDDYLYKVDIGVGNKDTVFAWTPEIGTDFWPASSEVISTCQGMVFPNLVLSHMAHRYLAVNDDDPSLISAMSGDFNHTATRFGREAGPVSVSIEPLVNIVSVGQAIVYDMEIRESATGTISYTLNPAIQYGDEIKYVLNTEYGSWTKRDTITKTYGAITLQFADNGSNLNNWVGSWETTDLESYSPNTSITDSHNSNYQNNAQEECKLIQTIDLTNATSAMVSFYAKWSIEADYDFCQFQVSLDNGATWLGQCGLYTVEGTSANGSVQPNNQPVWEGVQTDWVREEINLSDYLGMQIQVRFLLGSDGGVTDDGFYFDDFEISYNTSSVGLTELENQIKVFPNPANGQIVISSADLLSNETIVIHDAAGNLVHQENITEVTKQLEINTSSWNNGIYFLSIVGDYKMMNPVKFTIIH